MNKLTPPDRKRCQFESRSLMTLGPGHHRCNNQPIVIIRENKANKDGKKGSMSLCAEHLKAFMENDNRGVTIEQIGKRK